MSREVMQQAGALVKALDEAMAHNLRLSLYVREHLDRLRAALSVPADWKLVPVEPTQEMLSALEDALNVWVQEIGEMSDVYRAMLDAAPKAPSGEAVCKKCGADRLREPCKGSLMDCGFTGVAQSTSSGGEASNGKA